jgi:hypothetical protein
MPLVGKKTAVRARRRTPEAKLRKQAQALSGVALETLTAIMRGTGQDAVRLAAAREVLDRAHGRPKLGAPTLDASEGMTVIVKRFTDAPDPEADDVITEGG